MLNGSAAGLIGMYLITVLFSDNQNKLLAEISSEVGFLKWGGALMALFWLYGVTGGKAGDIVHQLTMMALIGLFLSRGSKPINAISDLFALKPGDVKTQKESKEADALDVFNRYMGK